MRPSPQQEARRLRPSFVGVVLLVPMLFVTLFSGPALGTAGTVLLVVAWVLALGLSGLLFTRRPRVVLALPALHLAAWAAWVWL
ncbi:hypothetical protein GCM10027425_09920 [Alteromonas gracilis]